MLLSGRSQFIKNLNLMSFPTLKSCSVESGHAQSYQGAVFQKTTNEPTKNTTKKPPTGKPLIERGESLFSQMCSLIKSLKELRVLWT